ncbi:NAD-dependent succinate-semialdehyde dehydrogenase [Celeribacter sp.]|uniref:NAD-dependent succinate-semialdehyde dehydrogenase n=1 Tax=Celeribacter sp. TaxID=1890673 RepID=UPI003A91CED4
MKNLRDTSLLKTHCWLAQGWVQASDRTVMNVVDPATRLTLGTVPQLSHDEIERAISGAVSTQKEWAALTAQKRSTVLRRWFDLIVENVNDLARILTAEQGKPLTEARNEILYAASFVEWFSEEAKRVYGETIPAPDDGQRITVLRQPVGVCAAITPWNFPAAMITRKVAPALAAGCAMIVRPSELTPFTALALAGLAERAGIPAGILQIVTGDAVEIGAVLTGSSSVRKLSFTGSTEVGRLLMAQCAPTIKKVSLELGGNAPFLVFDDADIDKAVEGALISKFRNAGQTCVCTNRFLVQDDVADEFARKLTEKVGTLKVGPGTEHGVAIGPLINERAVSKVREHVTDAISQGAEALVGGGQHELGSTYFSPTVLYGAQPSMRLANEETFGPVAPIFKFSTEAEGIAMANDTIFGLAAYFYTRDHARATRVSEALEFGMVGHNTARISNEVSPFGGIKQSGVGREGSRHGIDEYLEMKYLCSSIE